MNHYLPYFFVHRRSDHAQRWCWKLLCLLLAFGAWAPSQSLAQGLTVSGKITSADDGTGLPGVTVLLKGSSTGTSTDSEGNYKINISDPNGILVFSFIGYATQEVAITSRTVVDVSLSADVTELNEVVVVGYGTVKKTDLTGSVVAVDPEQITRRGSLGTLEGVQGQVAGVDISNNTGRSGSTFKMQIRGQQSLSGGQPLYVVDGVITDNIDFLNPQDIERMDILKDASSTAIYGSRGAFGVVIVTTKRGASVRSKASISYDGYYGVRDVARLPDFMPGDKWWNFRQDSYITSLAAGAPYDGDIGNNAADKTELRRRVAEKDFTDWPGLLLRTGRMMNHYVTISGMGENKLGYTIGAGYQEEKGNLITEEYKRYNFKTSVSQSINDHWNAGANINLAIIDKSLGSDNALVDAFRMSPLLKPYLTANPNQLAIQPGKDLPYIDMTSSVSPLFEAANTANDTRTFNAIGSVFLEYLPINWLSLKTTFQPRFKYDKNGKFFGSNTEGKIGAQPDAESTVSESFSYIWDNQISFNKTINEHSFNAMALYSMNMFRDETLFGQGLNLPYNSGYFNLGTAAPTNQRSASSFSKSTIMSYALRLNYTWKDKYLLTVSNRWDGSSVLAPGHKWASFPSAAVGWKISEEEFLKDVSLVNSLKLRASYGMTGNNQNVRPYDTQLTASTTTLYDFDGVASSGYAPGPIVSKVLSWEKVKEVDLGVDFSLLDARITGSIDYYNKLTNSVIYDRYIPLETGGYFTSPKTGPYVRDNIGEVRNSGIEVALNTVNISTDNFQWTTTFNFSKNKNEIVELNGKVDDPTNSLFIGHPIAVNYNYVFDGVWQANEAEQAKKYGQAVGQAKVKDYGDDATITPNDRRILGSPMPKWTGGFSTTFTYKGFDLSASLFTRQGVQVYSYFHEEFLNFEDRGRAKLNVDWYMPENNVTPARVSNEYPQPKNGGRFWNTEHVGFYKDASFVKVKNITLGYTFRNNVTERLKLNSLRVYANVLNPFVFTKYKGFDPEWAAATFTNTGNAFSNTQGNVSSITYQFGVNVKF